MWNTVKTLGLALGAKPGAIKKWRRNGVPHRYRLAMLELAAQRRMPFAASWFDVPYAAAGRAKTAGAGDAALGTGVAGDRDRHAASRETEAVGSERAQDDMQSAPRNEKTHSLSKKLGIDASHAHSDTPRSRRAAAA